MNDQDLFKQIQSPIVRNLWSMVHARRRIRLEEVLAQRTRHFTVVMERTDKIHNMAAVLRTCDSYGVQDVHLINPTSLKVAHKTSQGAHKWLTLATHHSAASCFEHLHGRGYRVAVTSLDSSSVPVREVDVREPLALVLGNEREGVDPETLALADLHIHIPMVGFSQSLNVSVATAIMISQLVTSWKAQGLPGGCLTLEEREALREIWYCRSVKHADLILARAGLQPPQNWEDIMIPVDEEMGSGR